MGSAVTLPVELLNFDANYVNDQVFLNWQTASELNNDYFSIEKTSGAFLENAEWKEIGRVSGAGSTNVLKEYRFIDDAINTINEVNYYRLKQVDFDGKYTYSDIISVATKDFKEIKVYPNPSKGLFKLYGMLDFENTNAEIYNSVGQLVSNQEVDNNRAIDISKQPNGIYFIRFGDRFLRVIKQ